MRRAAALGAAALVLAAMGCQEKPTPAKPPAAKPDATAPAAPKGPTLAERRARFEQRAVVEAPLELPPAWRDLPKALGDARLTGVFHEVRSRVDREPPYRHVHLQVRAFGTDAEVDAALLAALRGLELPGLEKGLPKGDVKDGALTWSVEVRRLIAPEGEAREHRVEIDWLRVPPTPADAKGCRRPPAVDAPAARPAWLSRPTDTRSTRRRISAAVADTPDGQRVTIRMRYRNGFAHDEAIGHLMDAARAAGLKQVDGSGPRQTWEGEAGRLSWTPDPSAMHLGCEINGPVVEIVWVPRRG